MPAAFWESAQMREAFATRHMGKIVRAFRVHAYAKPISQRVAAAWFYLTQAQLSRIESGPPVQNMDRLVQWAHILRIPADLLWFPLPDETAAAADRYAAVRVTVPPCPPPPACPALPACAAGRPANAVSPLRPMSVPGSPPSGPPDAAEVAGGMAAACATGTVRRAPHEDDDWRRMTELSRTAFAKRGLGAVTLPAVGLDELQHIAIALTDARRYADDSVVGYFRRRLDECAAGDRRSGPKRSIPMVVGVIAAIEQLAREAKPEVRHRLLRIGSRAAELAGFFYRDILMPELAGYWRDRAVEWAQAAGDVSMQGYVLLKKSQAAWDDRDGLGMLTLAQAVHEGPWRLPPHILAEAAQQEARAYALLGRPSAVIERRLDHARTLLDRRDQRPLDPDTGPDTRYDEALFNLQVALCHAEAGQCDRALAGFDDWLTPQTFSRRDYGYFLALKGLAYAVAEEPDEAAAAGLRALTLARETSSARTHQEVLRLAGRLRLWRDRTAVADLRDALLA
ncbi:MAG TPA: XRE family transcriptional regulator [Streptosporangiaceae bacterium]|nr:XRE family transcriptional regulator [Streptosporangiaceae bacterium]